ncbi:MAG: lipopolysaccharide biosynthesis protein [Sphingomonadales bacterium]
MTQRNAELAALAAGGRTSFFGFLLRLAARFPFLFIAGRMYGTEALGRFAYAVLVVEFAAQVATMGLKRGLAQQLSTSERNHSCDVWDAMIVCAVASLIAAGVLILLPQAMFPNSTLNGMDRLLPLIILPLAASDIALSALAYRRDLAATVRARSVVEPWVLGLTAGGLAFVTTRDGLIIAYVVSIMAACLASMIPLVKSFGFPPSDWSPRPGLIWGMARRNTPLAAADAIEWASRRIDIAILGLFLSPSAVGIYWGAQQVASLPQKLKTTFDPILAPVITESLGKGDRKAVARHIRQVAFWITAAQLMGLLMFGIPSVGVMGIIGPAFVMGAGALVVLLSAEVFASTGAVAESALIYVARKRNMMISFGTIVLQAVLCASLIALAQAEGLSVFWQMAAAALGLLLALFAASLAKAWLAERLLGGPVAGWRWTLVPAAGLAGAVGWAAVQYLPEWATMTVGMTAIAITYTAGLWIFAFGPEDRELFRLRRPPSEPAGPEPVLSDGSDASH